eukprot:GEMP01111312.1.p1 GENE.GEMP01111312.1~~GEMP01111312.1.p1  ORF type:complete len:111 (-),score=2.20 GEMP01111312.1:113-445(-)
MKQNAQHKNNIYKYIYMRIAFREFRLCARTPTLRNQGLNIRLARVAVYNFLAHKWIEDHGETYGVLSTIKFHVNHGDANREILRKQYNANTHLHFCCDKKQQKMLHGLRR